LPPGVQTPHPSPEQSGLSLQGPRLMHGGRETVRSADSFAGTREVEDRLYCVSSGKAIPQSRELCPHLIRSRPCRRERSFFAFVPTSALRQLPYFLQRGYRPSGPGSV
jgi:hypothetical protein